MFSSSKFRQAARLITSLLIIWGLAVLTWGSHAPWVVGAEPAAKAETATKTVQLSIDFGDGAELRFRALPWTKGMTALSALEVAANHAHGVKFKMHGAGTTAFVTQIDDLKNQGGGTTHRNWILKVDGEQSDVGAGAAELKPGAAVLWSFEVPDYNR